MQNQSPRVTRQEGLTATVFEKGLPGDRDLGTQLAAVILQLSCVRSVLLTHPDDADTMLKHVQTEIRKSIKNIREQSMGVKS